MTERGPAAQPDLFTTSVLAADPRARRVLALLRAMSEREAECWLREGQRIVRGEAPRDSMRPGDGEDRPI